MPTQTPTEGPHPGDREEIEEVEELLDRALAFSGTLGEYSPEALDELRSAHFRTRHLVGDWDANWPEAADDASSLENEVDDAE